MSWHCPACHSIIRHSEPEVRPRIGERYRCHVCRLTLEFDESADKLTITPLETDHEVERVERRPRAIPAPLTARRKRTKAKPVKRKRPRPKTKHK